VSNEKHQSWEDAQILDLLDDMARGMAEDPQDLLAGSSERAIPVRRAYGESLALLPYELDTVSPSAELKARILEEAEGERQQGGRRQTFERPSQREEEPRLVSSSPRWLLPLAATLAFVLVGVTGWQIRRVEKQAQTIAELSLELKQARMVAAELATAREVVAETRARLEMMTAATAEYCALKPTRSCPNQQARGTLVMQGDKNDWYLRVEGLGPCEKGRQYKLWFVTESEPVLGASFAVQGSHDLVEIRATGAPAGVKAVMITLEQPEVETAPESPVLLYGDQRMRIL
jgi:hypothetical protein